MNDDYIRKIALVRYHDLFPNDYKVTEYPTHQIIESIQKNASDVYLNQHKDDLKMLDDWRSSYQDDPNRERIGFMDEDEKYKTQRNELDGMTDEKSPATLDEYEQSQRSPIPQDRQNAIKESMGIKTQTQPGGFGSPDRQVVVDPNAPKERVSQPRTPKDESGDIPQ